MSPRAARGCFARALLLAVALSPSAPAYSDARRDIREKSEVRAIFDMLLHEMKPGDGWAFDLPCIFPMDWRDFVREGRTAESTRPRALLTPREALDPAGAHPERFCDLGERNARAKAMAKELSGDDHAHVTTADMEFSYPVFNRDVTRAILQHSGGNDSWRKDGRSEFVSSWRNVRLTKRRGRWTARFETIGIAN